MKKNLFSLAVFAVVLTLVLSNGVEAKTFKVTQVAKVTVDDNGVVTFYTCQDDVRKIKQLIQFCPDRFKKGCGNNIVHTPTEIYPTYVKFQLDKDAAQKFGQRAFNFKWQRDWLLIPDPLIEPERGKLKIELSAPSSDSEDGQGGHHFTWEVPAK